jgi:hypothetical protein
LKGNPNIKLGILESFFPVSKSSIHGKNKKRYNPLSKNSFRLFLIKNVQPSTQLSLLNSGISSGKLSRT